MAKRKHSELESTTPAVTKPRAKRQKQKHVGTENKEANLSQFQTDAKFAEQLYNETLPFLPGVTTFVEPSAGRGAFYNLMPVDNRIGIDIDTNLKEAFPQYIYADFLTLAAKDMGLDVHDKKHVAMIGNPPFSSRTNINRNEFGTSTGGSVNLALKFVNHAAKFSDTVAFILGCNFRKWSIQDRIDPELHLVYEQIINSGWQRQGAATFEIVDQGKTIKSVRTVFQIWQRKYDDAGVAIKRAKHFDGSIEILEGVWSVNKVEGDFKFLKTGDPTANVLVRKWASRLRVGDATMDPEKIKTVREKVTPGGRTSGTWFYLYAKDPVTVSEKLIGLKETIVEYCKDTSAVPSSTLNMKDLITIYTK